MGNIGHAPDGETAYLDFGFFARRPRIHELGYSLTWMILALDGQRDLEHFDWGMVPRLIEEYEAAANTRLTATERKALPVYAAAVPLYQAATCGFLSDPAMALRDEETRLPLLRIGEWLLTHTDAW